LYHHGILARSEKGFYLEILFYPLEKQFYLPAGFIDLDNGSGRKGKMICKKEERLFGFLVMEFNES